MPGLLDRLANWIADSFAWPDLDPPAEAPSFRMPLCTRISAEGITEITDADGVTLDAVSNAPLAEFLVSAANLEWRRDYAKQIALQQQFASGL